MGNPALTLVVPSPVSGTVKKPMPNRKANDQLRGRQHLSESEVARLEKAARTSNRWGHRDATMIMTAFRHGLRAIELVSMTWDQVDLDAGKLHVRRVKNSSPSTHISYSRRSGERRSPRRASARCSHGSGSRPGSGFP